MLDTGIFIGFLIINIIYGLICSKGVKNLKEYAVGDRNFSTAAISATLIATYLSGSGMFGDLRETYNNGLYYIWTVIAGITVLFLSKAFIFAPRMGEFLGRVSIADAMGHMFGKEVRIITSISCFVGGSAYIAMQLKTGGILFEYVLDIPSTGGIIIIGLIITAYSSMGGIKSVTLTDIIQFFTFGTIIPTIAYFILISMKNYGELIHIVKNNHLYNYKEVFDFTRPKSLEYLSLFLIYAVPGFSATTFQRISMCKNINQVINSHLIAWIVSVFVVLLCCFISVLVFTENSTLQGTEVFKYILSHYSQAGFRGLALVGVMAMVMSTADSIINATSVLFVNDFCKPLKIIKKVDEFVAVKVVAFLVGCVSISLAINSGSVLELFKLTSIFYLPIVSTPFMMALFGFRPHKYCIMIGMLGGFLTTIIWRSKLGHLSMDSLLPSMLLNLVGLVGSHYILKLPGGWVDVKKDINLNSLPKTSNFKLNNLLNKIENFSIIEFFRENGPKNSEFYILLGGISIVSGIINIFTLRNYINEYNSSLVTFIHISVAFIGTTFLYIHYGKII